MKLLVISDSHRNTDHIKYAAAQAKPDIVLHLGDCVGDACELQRYLPDTPVYMVLGNNDYRPGIPNEILLTQENVRIYMTHGHIYRVKAGLQILIEKARQQKADIALFGHTHAALLRQADGIWLMNPGQMMRHDEYFPATYGIIAIENGNFKCDIASLF
ncbi:MAG: metallophosphoesterase [Oscillospiraceae bacterium]|nr:metallophosphoesterase [Oscillospiraceae bacterium]